MKTAHRTDRLAEERIFAGASTGLTSWPHWSSPVNWAGHRVATVAVDTGLKYLSGNLFGAKVTVAHDHFRVKVISNGIS